MPAAKHVSRIETTLGIESRPGCLMLDDMYGSAGSNTPSLLFVSHKIICRSILLKIHAIKQYYLVWLAIWLCH